MYGILQRNKHGDNSAIIGTLHVFKDNILQFSCKTLENVQFQLEEGCYILDYTYSPKFDRNLYVISNHKSRQGIRIHQGNRVEDTTGCILVGAIVTRDKNDKLMITNSIYTLNELHRVTKQKQIKLTVL